MTRAELLAYIDNNVYPNANNEITALMVRDVLHRMVYFLGDAATYGVGDVAPSDPGLVTGGAVQGAINTALSSAIKFQGVTTTPLTDGSTDPDIVIAGDPYTARRGDEVIYGGREFLWTGSVWQQLGDEQSWALKTITISAGAGLVGGGDLTQNRTISLSQDSLDKLTAAGTIASYFSSGKLKYANLPDLYLARTKVKSAAAQDTLLGVAAISNAAASDASDKSRIEWDADNDAWHFYGNIYTDGWWSGRGLSPGSGGGGGGIDPAAMWSLLAAPTTEPINSTHISFPVTSVVGLQGAVSAAQIAAALGLGSLAYQSALTSAQVTNALGYTPQTEISDLSTIRSNASAGATIAGYFTNGKLGASHLPDLYLARTSVSETPANKTLYGVDGISHAAAADNTDKSRIVWDADNDAWHFYGNIYTDGWWSGRGLSPGSGGGGGGIDPAAMWSLLAAPTTEPINSTHISFPVTSVVGLQGAVSAAQIAAALGLGSLAYKSSLLASDIPDLSGTYVTLSTDQHITAKKYFQTATYVYSTNDANNGYLKHIDRTNNTSRLILGSSFGYNTPIDAITIFNGMVGIGIGNADPAYKLDVNGSFNATTIYQNGVALGARAFDSTSYLPLTGGTMSNTNLVTNLNADLLDGNHASAFARYVNEAGYDANSIPDGVYGGKLYGAANWPYNYYAFLSVGSGNYKFQLNGYNDRLQFRAGAESGLSNKEWRMIYHSGNSNKSDVAWSASSLSLPASGSVKFAAQTAYITVGESAGWNSTVVITGGWDATNGDVTEIRVAGAGANSAQILLNQYGSVGIGTSSPGYKLEVNGSAYASSLTLSGAIKAYTNNSATYGYIKEVDYSNNISKIVIGTCFGYNTEEDCVTIFHQRVGINNTTPSYALDVAGDIHASTGIWTDGYFSGRGLTQTSDERDKGGWRDITFTLADIVNAPAGSFAWLNAPGRSAGTTAQYWQKFTPELVGTKPDGKLSLEYGPLAFLIAHKTAEELYETNTKVDKQGEELRRVKEELGAAKIEIKNLRARLGIAS